jgi:hypothetical protein
VSGGIAPNILTKAAPDVAYRLPSETGEGQEVWDPPGCWWV